MLTAATRLDAMARLGKALADPTRCRILIALLEGPAYPAGLADRLGLTRSNVSNHLACLRGCGLVVTTDQGRHTRYEIADNRLAHAIDDLLGVVLAVDAAQPCLNDPHDTATTTTATATTSPVAVEGR
jgi:ArsR family transcriptional regulator, cadmium/lead-responsive transcriptional repressor